MHQHQWLPVNPYAQFRLLLAVFCKWGSIWLDCHDWSVLVGLVWKLQTPWIPESMGISFYLVT